MRDLEAPARAGEVVRMKFIVEHACARGHPLRVAGANDSACARRIAVRDLAVIDDCHGFEAAMRMQTDATRMVCREEIDRPGVIEQDERTGRRIVRPERQKAPRGKTVADPSNGFRRRTNALDVSHNKLLICLFGRRRAKAKARARRRTPRGVWVFERSRVRKGLGMDWLVLLIGSFCEVGWLVGMKYADGFTRFWPSVITVFFMIASIGCLGFAIKTIPAGTAYAIWTGGSIAAAAVAGVYLFGEPATPLRLASITLIVMGIVGLRLGGVA